MNGFTHSTIPGWTLDTVFTPEQVVRDEAPIPGGRVVIYDCEGYFMGVSLAEKLVRLGHDVTLVTPMMEPGPYMRFTGEIVHMRPLLERLGVHIVTEHLLTELTQGSARGQSAYVPEREVSWPADAVVLITQRNPNDELFLDLSSDRDRLISAGVRAVFRVGDCHSPRMAVAEAIFDGHRLAREIDAADPSVPLPYIRERRVIGATDADYESVISRGAV